MNLLIINLDKSIFRAGSSSLADLKDYSASFDKLFIITWTFLKDQGRQKPIIFGDKLVIYPTNSSSRLFYVWDTIKIFKKIIEKEKIDVISSQDPFETGFTAWIVSKKNKIPLHLQIHTDFLSSYFWRESFLNFFRALMAKFLIPRAWRIRVVSERIKKSLVASGYTLNPIAVLPIFVDIEKGKRCCANIDLHKKYPQFKFIILMASRITKEKNIKMAVKAMKNTVEKYPDTGLIIVGDGPERVSLELRVENLKLKDNVIFEPWTNDMFSYYKTANLFLLTSNYEGYGRTVIEAMATGCPVVMTDVGIAGDILINNRNGFVIPVNNGKKLEHILLKILHDKIKPLEVKQQAQRDLNSFPDREKYLREYKQTWES